MYPSELKTLNFVLVVCILTSSPLPVSSSSYNLLLNKWYVIIVYSVIHYLAAFKFPLYTLNSVRALGYTQIIVKTNDRQVFIHADDMVLDE